MAAEKGNKYAQIWTEDEAKELFMKGLNYAKSNTQCLHLADAIYETGIPYSTYDYLAEKHKVLGLIKKDTKMEVLRRINRGTLDGSYPPASGIWRMKQLGESDKLETKTELSGVKGIKVEIKDFTETGDE
jgi:hypothetical protein